MHAALLNNLLARSGHRLSFRIPLGPLIPHLFLRELVTDRQDHWFRECFLVTPIFVFVGLGLVSCWRGVSEVGAGGVVTVYLLSLLRVTTD